MSYQIVSIGGCGAKSVESLTHLCSAGLMPDGDLNVLFIDPDLANGCLERSQNSLNQYIECKKIGFKETVLFKTPITLSKPNVWTPFEDQAKPTLEKFFRYSALKTQDKAAAHFFDVLFSSLEKETLLDEGFLGHPSIGAAVLAKTVKLGETEPWKTFKDNIEQDAKEGKGSKILLIGSIFGGTGAAGLPTIARLIRKEVPPEQYKNVKIGAVLLLPYFSFAATWKKTPDGRVFKLNPENFILNTQASLKYYFNQKYLDCFDCLYLLGEHNLSPVKNPTSGGRDQANAPNIMELFAAQAALDFFENIDENVKDPNFDHRKYHFTARGNPKEVIWSDLPDGSNGNKIKTHLGRLTRFAFAYLHVYYPMLKDIMKKENTYKAPWFVQFFERKEISLNDDSIQNHLKSMGDYCETFLKWIANINYSSGPLNIKLVNFEVFAELDDKTMKLLARNKFDGSCYENLILPPGKEDKNGLDNLWETMSDTSAKGARGVALEDFLKTLFDKSLESRKPKYIKKEVSDGQ